MRAYALVDEADFAWLSRWRWYLGSHGYPVRKRGAGRCVLMHRQLMGQRVDHINGDHFDCRRANLRPCTQAQNLQNRTVPMRNNTSGFRGVSWEKRRRRWEAYAKLNRRKVHLGLHATAEEADRVVKAWRAEHMPFSEDARLVA